MNGIQYEKACVHYLSHNGYHNIQMTPVTGDQGIDIIAVRRHKRYGFQCKYYTKKVGNDAVQQAIAGRSFYDLDHVAVITNSTFTPAAVRLAEAADVRLMDKVSPSRIYLPSAIAAATGFLYACMGIAALLKVGANELEGLHNLRVFHGAVTVMAGTLTALGERRYNVMLYAVVFHVFALFAAAAIMTVSSTLSFKMQAVFGFILFVYSASQLIALGKIRLSNHTALERRHLLDQIEEKNRETGITFGALLERDLHCGIRLVSYEHPEPSVSVFVYETNADVSEQLPVLEALLNHTANSSGLSDCYSLQEDGRNRFIATITSSEN